MLDIEVVKRDGEVVKFDRNKIEHAIEKAFVACHQISVYGIDKDTIRTVVNSIEEEIAARFIDSDILINVENIHDIVEKHLMKNQLFDVAKSYIVYRAQKRQKESEDRKKVSFLKTLVVKKKDGTTVPFSPRKLKDNIKRYAKSLPVDLSLVFQETVKNVYDGMKSEDIDRALILSATALVEREPAYSTLAARFFRQKLGKEVFGKSTESGSVEQNKCYHDSLKTAVKSGVDAGVLDKRLLEFDLDVLSGYLVLDRDELLKYIGVQTLYERYFAKIESRRIEMPQVFWMRVAMGLAINEEKKNQKAMEFYDLMSQLLYTPSTPTLFHSGLTNPQLSSCYLSTVDDDLKHIFRSFSDNAQMSKWSGGIGNDWTSVRATGAIIKTTMVDSQGVIPFLKIANDTTVAINRSGKRRGATAAYLETWHLDIEDFLDLRKNTGDDRRRTADMNTVNWIPDLFMKRVQEGGVWTLFSPDEVPDLHHIYGKKFEDRYTHYEKMAKEGKIRRHKVLEAQKLYRKMLTMLFETGHPWLCFPGETLVAVADGRNAVSIKELAISNERFPVYCARPHKRYQVGEKRRKNERYWIEDIKWAKAFHTGTKEIVKVLLDDGTYFKCTPDHLIALKGGGYCCAKDLKVGESLSAFNSIVDKNRPNHRWINKIDPRKRQSNMIWEFHNGKLQTGKVVDHIVNGIGDFIDNLQILSVDDHNTKTSSERHGDLNPFFGKHHSDTTIVKFRNRRCTSEQKEAISKKLKGVKKPDRYDLTQKDLINLGKMFLNKYGSVSNKKWKKHFKEEKLPSSGYIENRFGKWSNFTSIVIGNHKVVSVERTGEVVDVYDLKVEDNHNFYIITSCVDNNYSGVLVHNCFKDPCNIRSPQDHVGVIHNSNLCSEITLNTKPSKLNDDSTVKELGEIAVCNLGSLNIFRHMHKANTGTQEAVVNWEQLAKTIKTAMRMLDNVIDINFYPVPEARNSNLKHRPVGLGFMGLQDALFLAGIRYEEADDFVDQLQEFISFHAIWASSALAAERGTYESYKGSKWDRGIFPIDTIDLLEKDRGIPVEVDRRKRLDWAFLREHVINHGMRNSNTMAVAPTATIGNIAGVLGPNGEAVFKNLFTKSNMSGEFTVINEFLIEDLKKEGLWDKDMLDKIKYHNGSIQKIEEIPLRIRTKYKEVWEIDQKRSIDLTALRSKWIDQSQSHNIFIAHNNGKVLADIYMYAWRKGLKTTYYLRTLGVSGVEKATLDAKYGLTQKRDEETVKVCKINDPTCEACQ
jgi:ribonucleotide reductase alpha subunit